VCIGNTGRVGWAVDDDYACFRCNRRFQLFRGDLETCIDTGANDDRLSIGQTHHVRVGHPVGCRDDDFITWIEQCLAEVEKTLLAAAGHQYLVKVVVQPVIALEFRYNRFFERGCVIHRGVASETFVYGLDCGGLDVVGGVKIGFAGTQPDNVFVSSTQLSDPRCDGERR